MGIIYSNSREFQQKYEYDMGMGVAIPNNILKLSRSETIATTPTIDHGRTLFHQGGDFGTL